MTAISYMITLGSCCRRGSWRRRSPPKFEQLKSWYDELFARGIFSPFWYSVGPILWVMGDSQSQLEQKSSTTVTAIAQGLFTV
jgi:hypothetical protein